MDDILLQDYPRELLEVLLIDGGSTDGTVDLIQKYVHNNDLWIIFTMKNNMFRLL